MMALTARQVETAKSGRHSDGAGLTLLVAATGARSWVLRVQVTGLRRDVGIGGYPELNLAKAREKAREWRKAFKEGRDPRAQSDQAPLTFREAAERLIASKRHEWRNAKHASQWGATLASYVYPTLGERDVAGITKADVLGALQPIWTAKPETASRTRQRIEAVLDYAAAIEARTGENPARWRGNLAHLLPRPTKIRAVEHHAAMDWQ